MAERPATKDECLTFLNGPKIKCAAWRVDVGPDGQRYRTRSATLELDALNSINYTSKVLESDSEETDRWIITAAQKLFDAQQAFDAGI